MLSQQLSNIRETIVKEKNYFYLAFMLVIILGAGFLYQGNVEAPQEASQVAQPQVKELEQNWDYYSKNEEYLKSYFQKNPLDQYIFLGLQSIFVIGVILGLVFAFQFFKNPDQANQRWLTHLPPPGRNIQGAILIFKALILFICFSLVLGIVFGFFVHLLGRNYQNLLMLSHTFITDFFCVWMVIYLLKEQKVSWKSELGFKKPAKGWLNEALLALRAYIVTMPWFILALLALVFIAQYLKYEPPAHPLINVFVEEENQGFQITIYLSILLAVLVGPIIEEIFFRGFCYPILRAKTGRVMGIILSAAFFAAIHQSIFAFFPIFILGCFLAILYELRGSIFAPCVMHIIHNSIFIFYFFQFKKIIPS